MNTEITDQEYVDLKIYIAVPSTERWEAQFGMAYGQLMFYIAQFPIAPNVRKQQVTTVNRKSSMLCQSREDLLQEAIDTDCTHILWLDSDMTFPADIVHKLYAHNRTFVGANYVRKMIPSSPVSVGMDGELLFTDELSTGLETALHIGLGACLMRLEDIKDIPAPRFAMEWNEKLGVYSGEDVYLAKKLRHHGIPCYIDHDVSHSVSHVGNLNYDHSLVGEVVAMPEEEEDGNKIHIA